MGTKDTLARVIRCAVGHIRYESASRILVFSLFVVIITLPYLVLNGAAWQLRFLFVGSGLWLAGVFAKGSIYLVAELAFRKDYCKWSEPCSYLLHMFFSASEFLPLLAAYALLNDEQATRFSLVALGVGYGGGWMETVALLTLGTKLLPQDFRLVDDKHQEIRDVRATVATVVERTCALFLHASTRALFVLGLFSGSVCLVLFALLPFSIAEATAIRFVNRHQESTVVELIRFYCFECGVTSLPVLAVLIGGVL